MIFIYNEEMRFCGADIKYEQAHKINWTGKPVHKICDDECENAITRKNATTVIVI